MRANFRILLIEDSPSFRDAVTLLVGVYNDIDTAMTLAEARAALEKAPYDVVILDRFLPDGDGLDLIAEIKRESPNTAVIIVTSDSDLNTIKKGIDSGASDYVVKKGNAAAELLIRIPIAVSRLADARKLSSLEDRLRDALRLEMVGSSPALMELRGAIYALKGSRAPILIIGESGSGKGRVAHMIHRMEAETGRDRPFVVVRCTEIEETLSASDLFGQECGSQTKAAVSKPGRFELAHGGDIFLDEISDLSWEAQGRLLRVLDEGRIYRLGGTKPIQVNCRVIAATHQDLKALVARRKFRPDLFNRLTAAQVRTPPLRDRKEDIPAIAKATLLEKAKTVVAISEPALQALQAHHWPGNAWELCNTIERAILLMRNRQGTSIEYEDISIGRSLAAPDGGARRMELALPQALSELSDEGYRSFLELSEREYLRAALRLADESVAEVAARIGVGRSTLFRKLAQVGLERRTSGLRTEDQASKERIDGGNFG